MPHSADRSVAPAAATLRVDRIACTGHGICAQLLPDVFALDEWGYPIMRSSETSDKDAALAVKLCPSRALYRA